MIAKTLLGGEYRGEKLLEKECPYFRLSLTQHGADQIIEPHVHENAYMSILVAGNYIENNSESKSLIARGDALFRPAWYQHGNTFQQAGGVCFNIELKSDWADMLGFNFNLPAYHQHFNAANCPSLLKLLISFKSFYSEDLAVELVCDWLFTLKEQKFKPSYPPWLENACRILDYETETFHSLQSLAERIHVHHIYLARVFKERKGITIGEYQLKSKLSRAVRLLLNTSYTISEISFLCGFYDNAHFTRSFKEIYKMAPFEFRRSVKS